MSDNYAKIVRDNLDKLYKNFPDDDLAGTLPADREGDQFVFEAFGEKCRIGPEGIILGKENQAGVTGILISLYALHASPEPYVPEPLKSFRDFPDSMAYAGAFATHTEHILVPHVEKIENASERIIQQLGGEKAPEKVGGDFSFVIRPLPKISLCYIFYKADDEFPASATCLFSGNALTFMPIDGLADVGEYTSKKIMSILGAPESGPRKIQT